MFAPENTTQGNLNPDRHKYTDPVWIRESKRFRSGRKCEAPMCLSMASMVDHVIPMKHGGSQFDRRNWMPMCKKHHDKKRGREAHGQVLPYTDTPNGRIPSDRAHLPPDIAGQSHLLQHKD